jgi:hypothetical protein
MGSVALTFWKDISKGSVVEVDLAILVAPSRNGLLYIAIKKSRRVWHKGMAQHTSDFGMGEIASDSRNLKEDVLSTSLVIKNMFLTRSVIRPYVFIKI